MDRMKFNDNTEIEIIGALKNEDELNIKVVVEVGRTLNDIVEVFGNETKTSVMRRYDDENLLDGYAGYTKMQNVVYQPNVTTNIDYEEIDPSTESGFKETKVNICTVTMRRASSIAVVARQTDQNTANIDYIAMETGVDL